MSAPKRIKRERTTGWTMPEGAVYVGRPTRWGNPYIIGKDGDASACVAKYRAYWDAWLFEEPGAEDRLKRLLGGKDLACWCNLTSPCHADVLLELANGQSKKTPTENIQGQGPRSYPAPNRAGD